jgi:tetratricopeptide (TPR) repeat protein
MSDPIPTELIQAEELISKGKIEEALEKVRKFQQTAWTYFYRFESDKALEIALQSKNLIEKIGEEIDLANSLFIIGHIYLQKRNIEDSLNYGMKSLELREKLDNRVDYGASLSLIGLIHFLSGKYTEAVEFLKESLSYSEITSRVKLDNYNNLANICLWRGELSQSLEYTEEGMKLAKKLNLFNYLAQFLYYRGFIFALMGDFNNAEDYLKKCLEYSETPEMIFFRGWAILELIEVFVEENSMNQAGKYLEILKGFADQTKSKSLSRIYSVSRGITLFQSSRTRDRAEAENLFKKVVDDGVVSELNKTSYMYALYCLTFMYIEELRLSNDLKIIEDINPLISTMFMIAEQLQSSMFQIEGKIFQAKIELIQMNFEETKILLAEAQRLAESTYNQYLAQIISNEHDRLLELQDNREQLGDLNPKPERIKLASFNGIANLTQREPSGGSPELIPEIPVLLLIIAEGGVLIFSYPFADEWKYDTEIFGSFLSAFNSFSDEFFSKGLDRVKFGDDTLLIQSVGSFSVSYLYKGQTYPAKQKLTAFLEEVQNNSTIWQTLKKLYKTSRVAELKDIPQIENLIKDIFIT